MTDLEIAKKYVEKAKHAQTNGKEFKLSFVSFKNMMRSKKCAVTGLEFRNNKKFHKTIDRIDNNKGYVNGNVRCIIKEANSFKAILENPDNPITPEIAIKIAKYTKGVK